MQPYYDNVETGEAPSDNEVVETEIDAELEHLTFSESDNVVLI